MRNRIMRFSKILFKASQEIIVCMVLFVEVSNKTQVAQQVRRCGPVETTSSTSIIISIINLRKSELLRIKSAAMNSTNALWRKKKKAKCLYLVIRAALLSLHIRKQNNLVKTINTKISNNYFSVPWIAPHCLAHKQKSRHGSHKKNLTKITKWKKWRISTSSLPLMLRVRHKITLLVLSLVRVLLNNRTMCRVSTASTAMNVSAHLLCKGEQIII